MTREKPTRPAWPTPLLERQGGLGKLVREYVHETEEKGGDDAAYARLAACTGRPGRGRAFPILAVTLAAACGAIATTVLLRGRPVLQPPVALPTTPPPVAVPPPVVPPPAPPRAPIAEGVALPALRLGVQAMPLPAGPSELVGQGRARLSADGVAVGRTREVSTEIVLGRGDLELQVLPRAPGHRFSVRAGAYRFTVVGTLFTVSQTGSRLELAVREGKVAVSRGRERLAMVVAGEKWAVALAAAPVPVVAAPLDAPPVGPTPLVPAPVASPHPSAPPAALVVAPPPATSVPSPSPGARSAAATAPTPPAASDCRQLLASQRTSEALLCYQTQAARGGLAGETAQYELARLLRDSFGDLGRAFAAFQDQRARFPRGALRMEADLSIIELLPRLGRHDEAMSETEKLLAEHPTAERRGELRLLRGNILREVVHDLGRAEREYAQGAEARGHAGDDCRFLRAVCLESLGHLAEARAAYEAYLRDGKAAHAPEVRKRLEHLRP